MDNIELPIPEEYEGLEIGSCFNSITRELSPYSRAFSMKKFQGMSESGEEILSIREPDSKTIVIANASNFSQTINEFSENSIGVGFDAIYASANMGFASSTASSNQFSGTTKSLIVSKAFVGGKIVLVNNLTENQLYSCMTENFRELYDKLKKAKNEEEYSSIYDQIISKYGDSFISEITLISSSTGVCKIKYNEEAKTNSKGYAVSAEVGTYGASLSAARKWGKDTKNLSGGGDVKASIVTSPASCPAHNFIETLMDRYIQGGLATIETVTSSDPNLPTIRDIDPPSVTPAPYEPKVPPTASELEDEKRENVAKQEMMKKDNFDETRCWEEYVKEIRNKRDKVKVSDIARATSTKKYTHENENLIKSTYGTTTIEDNSKVESNEFKSYRVIDYKLTKFSKILPIFKLNLTPSMTSINIAKAYMYFMTRVQFGKYLEWQYKTLPKGLHNNSNIADDVMTYNIQIIEYYNEWLKSYIKNNKKFTDANYDECLREFESRLQKVVEDEVFGLGSKKVYDFFFNNYDFFNDAAYGYLPKVEIGKDEYYSDNNKLGTWKKEDGGRTLRSLLKEAGRVYPVIQISNKEAHLILCSYSIWRINETIHKWGGWKSPFVLEKSSNVTLVSTVVGKDNFTQTYENNYDRVVKIKDIRKNSFKLVYESGKNASIPKVLKQVGSTFEYINNDEEYYETIDIRFYPIDHNNVLEGRSGRRGTEVIGLPMWDKLPFDTLKQSMRIDELVK